MIQYGGPLEDMTYFFALWRHNILLMLPLRDLCVLEYHMVILQFEVAGIQILFLFLCQVPVHENQPGNHPWQSWILCKLWSSDPRFWIGRFLCQWNWDSGFQSLAGFRVPWAQDSGFHEKRFPGFWNPDTLTWNDFCVKCKRYESEAASWVRIIMSPGES